MNQQAFIYTTGVGQSFTVPDGVNNITITAIGGGGAQGRYADGCPGGGGGKVQATFNITPQAILTIYIGGQSLGNGYNNINGNGSGGSGGAGGVGGSATCVTVDNDTTMLIIAGGGGGGAYITSPASIGAGGYGGGNLNANGGNGGNTGGGGGGVSTGSGGSSAGNPGTSGSLNGINLGNGGNSTRNSGGGGGGWGGGGGGYGGGGAYSGGGGGSSFVNQAAVVGTPQYSYVKETTGNGGTYGAGGQTTQQSVTRGSPGNSGYVLITWQDPIMNAPSIALGNWSKIVQDFVKGKTLANYTIADLEGDRNPGPDSCKKNFMATYKCGNFATLKTINIPGEARGQTAIFDCSEENKMCTGLRLTLGDDGNLVLTDADNKPLWASNTSKTGLALAEFSAPQGKYGRNYLLVGETLNLNEFIGSPTGNCYLIMANTPEGNGLQLKYSVLNCDEAQYGNDETTNGLFSLAQTAYNELVGVKNKIKPKMEKLSKTLPVAEELFSKQTSQMQTDTHTYLGVVTDRQKIHTHIKQLDAMDEDSDLLLTRYKYRRIVWLALVIVLMFGGIKLARNNS